MVKEISITEKPKLERALASGANWFFWIGGLSLVNSLMALAGSKSGFVIGLGVTQVVDAVARHFDHAAAKVFAISFNLIAVGICIGFGVLGRKKYTWAFVVGMILYGLDLIIILLAGSVLGIVLHAMALFSMFVGMGACAQLKRWDKAALEQAGPYAAYLQDPQNPLYPPYPPYPQYPQHPQYAQYSQNPQPYAQTPPTPPDPQKPRES